MTLKEIMTLPIEAYMPREVKALRKNAPKLVSSVLLHATAITGINSLADLTHDSIQALSGGLNSAVYLIRQAENNLVIKLRPQGQGISAEAEALTAWAAKGASVTTIKKVGTVSSGTTEVKYMIQEGITRTKGRPAVTCHEFLRKHPSRAKAVGKLLGKELALMHKAKSDRTFGEYSDMWGKKAPYKTWNAYLVSSIQSQEAFLKRTGMQPEKIDALLNHIATIRFSKTGAYIHGDYSIRNALVESQKPLRIRIFDPNPLIGDPGWDIAFFYFYYDLAKRRLAESPKDKQLRKDYLKHKDVLRGFISGYEEGTGRVVNLTRVHPSQFITTMFALQGKIAKAKVHTKNYWSDPEVQVCRQSLFDLASQMIAN